MIATNSADCFVDYKQNMQQNRVNSGATQQIVVVVVVFEAWNSLLSYLLPAIGRVLTQDHARIERERERESKRINNPHRNSFQMLKD